MKFKYNYFYMKRNTELKAKIQFQPINSCTQKGF